VDSFRAALQSGDLRDFIESFLLMAELQRNALLIVNPRAGRVRYLLNGPLERIRAGFAGQGIASEVAFTDTPEAAEDAARRAAADGRDLVIACGGDGTVNAIVNGLVFSQTPLALLPAGTANVLAKELNLPSDAERAASYIASSVPRRIALGRVASCEAQALNRYFLAVGGAGPDGAIVQGVHQGLKKHAGQLAFWFEGLRQFVAYRYPRFRVIADGVTREATMIIVGRAKHYGGPLRITTEADLYGNDFEVMTCATRNSLSYMSFLPLAFVGQVRRSRAAQFFRTTSLRCEPIDDPVAFVQVDGEPAGRLPVEFQAVPDALTLMIPRSMHRS
jgi:diacylglycerol kinase (ATP)